MTHWKPGDVARTQEGVTVFLYRSSRIGDGEHWTTGDLGCWSGDPSTLSPLIVLDLKYPGGIVASLREAAENDNRCAAPLLNVADQIEAQIRPPKPSEPTGAGAVVEDAMGHLWVRIADASEDPIGVPKDQASPPWRHRGHAARWWGNVNAVRVLSEGVTP